MTEVENLRRMNTDMNRTDVENLFLKEMMEEDAVDFFNEDTEFDALVTGESDSLFSDSSSEDFDDTFDLDNDGLEDITDLF